MIHSIQGRTPTVATVVCSSQVMVPDESVPLRVFPVIDVLALAKHSCTQRDHMLDIYLAQVDY